MVDVTELDNVQRRRRALTLRRARVAATVATWSPPLHSRDREPEGTM